eukprot:NODE_543_length_2612_cov_74.803937_g466_i0.p1 GENE.NODE_543_length_2612_cov_74.803937_g466_i0~~NODE_543_length_2612_cov_74.803937_g466_i0.p1  ORF type:complete len:812 (+),score=207.62 NODE_543_length_2612_cov_74.803937_g466_i0:55-2490(+)
MDPSLLEKVRSCLRSVRVPSEGSQVYKDQCMFSFDSPFSPDGLFVSLSTHYGFGRDYLDLDHEKTSNRLYLHEKWTRVPKPPKKQDEITKVGIGVEGGFDVAEAAYDVEKMHSIFIMPEKISIPYPCPELPEIVIQAADSIIAHKGSLKDAQVAWEEESYQVSVCAADLVQISTGKKISPDPKTWIDEETGEQSENLWLNLSDGFIGGGRRQMNSEGKWVGSGSALRHYEQTGRKYPLAVKLGTITPRGADVYSYAEDTMVIDPFLAQHLAHWGINMGQMEKTSKSIAELNVDINLKFEYSKIIEGDKELEPISGAGYIGIENLGATCYMNSVVQSLFMLPEFKTKYVDAAELLFRSAPSDPTTDFPTQMAKLGLGLLTDRYKEEIVKKGEPEDPNTVRVVPFTFKSLVGKGHPEFSSERQQDAAEYFLHLLEYISRDDRKNAPRYPNDCRIPDLFKFDIETRTECTKSGQVKYDTSKYNILELPIPLDQATNREAFEAYRERQAKRQKTDGPKEDETPIFAEVPFSSCLAQLAGVETITDYYSPAVNEKTIALRTTRIKTFPRYLLVQLRKFYVDTDWTPKKMEVDITDIPDTIHLELLRGTGPQPGETLMSDSQGTPKDEFDPVIVATVTSMGFSENAAKRACKQVKSGDAEGALNWVLQHLDDADINSPLPSTKAGPTANAEDVENLMAMGFIEQQAKAALIACQNDVQRAVDWLFSHADDLDAACVQALGTDTTASTNQTTEDGRGEYTLMGFISHLGKNTSCGHYVCHLRKGGRWVLFNDQKVGIAENPKRGMAYLYLFRRTDAPS